MRLGQYTRAEISIVTALALQGYAFGTTRMTPNELARFIGIGRTSVYKGIRTAETSGLITRVIGTGELTLTTKAVDAIREGFRHGFDGKRRAATQERR